MIEVNRMGLDSQTIETSSPRRHGRVITVLTGVSLSLTGCTLSSPEVQSTPTPTPTLGGSLFETYSPQYGDCNPGSTLNLFADLPKALDKYAQECLDVYDDAEIAMINYSLNDTDANALALGIEQNLDQATMGIIQPEITVIEPSELAKSIFEYNTPTGCAEYGDLEDYGSFIAAATMPELSKYDLILGVSNNTMCIGGIAGVADGSYNRYAEIFTVNDDLATIKANGGKTSSETQLGDGLKVTKYTSDPSLTSTHELLHNFGLGHSGELYNNGSTINYGLFNSQNRLDLANYFGEGIYREYGTQDVMGNPTELADGTTLNLVQISLIEWPEQALGVGVTVEKHDIWQSPATFTSANTSTVANINLPVSLPFPAETNGFSSEWGSMQIYDKLAFTSIYREGEIVGIEVYVIGTNNNIIDLGAIYRSYGEGAPSHYELFAEGANISIDFGENTATVSAVKTELPEGM